MATWLTAKGQRLLAWVTGRQLTQWSCFLLGTRNAWSLTDYLEADANTLDSQIVSRDVRI